MASPWAGVLEAIEDELSRTAQHVRGRRILASRIAVRVPLAAFGRWEPVLEGVTGELGEALIEWAGRHGREWYGGQGPELTVELAGTGEVEVVVGFPDPSGAP